MESGQNQQSRFIYLFSLIGIVAIFIFAVVNILEGNTFVGFAEIGLWTTALINVVYFRFFKNFNIASIVILIIMLLVSALLIVTGGLQNTGFLWVSTFPPLAFFLARRNGFLWVGILLAFILGLIVLDILEIFSSAYSIVELRQLGASLLALSFIIYFYYLLNTEINSLLESERLEAEKAQEDLNKEAIKTKKTMEELSKRTEESERLNRLVLGRELKMMELKKEIVDLKAKNKN